MAAGLSALRRFTPEDIGDLNSRGDELRGRLRCAGVPVNGSGSLIRVLLQNPAQWWDLYRAGVLAGTNGLLALSTPMTGDHLSAIADAVIGVCSPTSD